MEKFYLTNKVAEIRKSKGWSAEDFIGLLSMRLQSDIAYSTYGMWERGQRSVNATIALAVANLLDVNIKEIAELK